MSRHTAHRRQTELRDDVDTQIPDWGQRSIANISPYQINSLLIPERITDRFAALISVQRQESQGIFSVAGSVLMLGAAALFLEFDLSALGI